MRTGWMLALFVAIDADMGQQFQIADEDMADAARGAGEVGRLGHSATLHIRRLPDQMLAAIHRDHLAGDGVGLQQIAHRGADVRGLGAVAQDGGLALAGEIGFATGARCGWWGRAPPH